MRGGVPMQDLLHVYTADDRDAMAKLIEENLEVTKETKIPFI